MKILALDLGKFNSAACCFSAKTRNSKFVTVPTTRQHLEAIFADCQADLVVMEACGPSGWINDLALDHGLKTLVCSTNEEAWRWANVKRKTDKDDALKLARLAAMGELKPVHMPSLQHREFRSLVKYRKTLDRRINKTKNTIRAWFVNHGITIDSGEKAWHTGREKIDSFRKPMTECEPDELWKGELDIELTILDSLTLQLDGVVKKLEAIGKTDDRIRRVQTIPGVGPRTAEILVACIDDPHRFENGRQVSAYFGLVPRQYQSGETDRNGRITKRGNPLARTILVECAWASTNESDLAVFHSLHHSHIIDDTTNFRVSEEPAPHHLHFQPRTRPIPSAEHPDKLMLTFHLGPIASADRRTVRHIALKNVPHRRKVACCSPKPPGKLQPNADQLLRQVV